MCRARAAPCSEHSCWPAGLAAAVASEVTLEVTVAAAAAVVLVAVVCWMLQSVLCSSITFVWKLPCKFSADVTAAAAAAAAAWDQQR